MPLLLLFYLFLLQLYSTLQSLAIRRQIFPADSMHIAIDTDRSFFQETIRELPNVKTIWLLMSTDLFAYQD